jgi:hypothetical protein
MCFFCGLPTLHTDRVGWKCLPPPQHGPYKVSIGRPSAPSDQSPGQVQSGGIYRWPEFDSRAGVSRLQPYPRLAHASYSLRKATTSTPKKPTKTRLPLEPNYRPTQCAIRSKPGPGPGVQIGNIFTELCSFDSERRLKRRPC